VSFADDLKSETADTADKVRSERDELKKRLDDAHVLIDKQQATLERRVKPRIRLPTMGRPASSYFRVVVPDTHGCFIDRAAFAALLGDLPLLQPRELILLGDHVDCSGFLAEHLPLHYVDQAAYSYEDDVDHANAHLDAILSMVPEDCVVEYLEGNHERRVEKWVLGQKLRHSKDQEAMVKLYAPRHRLGLEKRGVTYYPVSEFHDGLRTRGTIKRGKCYFVHGFSHAKKATEQHLQKIGANVVHGHTHRVDSASLSPVEHGNMQGWCPGTLSTLVPMYRHGAPTDWSHGYAIQLVSEDQTFLHINVPIIDGRSYLAPLVEHLRR